MNDINFKKSLAQHDEYKIWIQKLSLLKQGLKREYQISEKTREEIRNKREACRHLETEIIRKGELNQSLRQQSKSVMDEIMSVRARKKKLMLEIMSLESDNESGAQGAKSIETSQN